MGDDGFLLLQLVLIVMEMFLLIFNGSKSFSVKIQIMDISGSVSNAAPISAPWFCPRTMKAGIDTVHQGARLCSKARRAGLGPWVTAVNP